MHLKLQGWRSGAITTLGRGGSDLTATTIGKALGLREIQVCNCFPRLSYSSMGQSLFGSSLKK
jgi:hypothetical protein